MTQLDLFSGSPARGELPALPPVVGRIVQLTTAMPEKLGDNKNELLNDGATWKDFSSISPAGQTTQILNHLQSGHTITPLEALDMFGCFRLGARIYDLKRAGYEIKTEMVTENGKRFARYSL